MVTDGQYNLEELYKKRDEINTAIDRCCYYISTHFSERDSSEYLAIESEYDQLKEMAQEIDKKILLAKSPIASNNKIDLRTIGDEICNEYYIYLHGTAICIGKITYRGYHLDSFMGDIGYTIDEKYRGNNYSYEALLLLSSWLSENGIDSFIITVYKYNIPSVKIIEKYGGLLMGEDRGVLKYECKTLGLNIEQQSSKTM